MTRTFWLVLGYAATGLAIAGVILPLVPATPFLLVAAYAFARSSPRAHAWLTTHPTLGPLIENWNRHGAISVKAKASAVFVMIATLAASWYWGVDAGILVVQAVVMALSAAFILSRPNGPNAE